MLQSEGDPHSAGAHVEQQSFRSPHQHPPRAARWPARHRMRGLLPSIRHLAVRPGLNDGWSVRIKEVKGLTTSPPAPILLNHHHRDAKEYFIASFFARETEFSVMLHLGSLSKIKRNWDCTHCLHYRNNVKYEINVYTCSIGQIIWSWKYLSRNAPPEDSTRDHLI